MYFFTVLCVYAGIVERTAAQSAACSVPENVKDGFSLLQVGVTFRLAHINFGGLTVNTIRCIIATTTLKDEGRHEVTEHVQYMEPFVHTHSFTQSFQFTCESERYNTMTSIDNSTVPHASYKFLSPEPTCAIVEYVKQPADQTGQDGEEKNSEDGKHAGGKKEEAQPQARDSSTDGAKRAHLDCMLWLQGLDGEPSEECEKKFTQLCGTSVKQRFSTMGCDMLYNEVKREQLGSAQASQAANEKTS
uniref:Putative lipocalin-6 1 n=1 Tax=Amblyomma triste TaxID=251400 RepID=A0A023G8T7_AMBTT